MKAGNIYDKYRTKNPLYKLVVNQFLKTLDSIVISLTHIQTVLEVGCGEGYLLNRVSELKRFSRLEGIDISEEIIEKAKKTYPSLGFFCGSAYNLNYGDNEFDLVLACEILEHLENPAVALAEIKRVTSSFVIISVPLEPLWRILNIVRGAYIFSLGNTPGHIQHWDKVGFLELIKKYFVVEKILYPLPWQMALCSVRRQVSSPH